MNSVLAVVLGVPIAAALGCAVPAVAVRGAALSGRQCAQCIALAIASGILVHASLGLLLADLRTVGWLCVLLAVAGVAYVGVRHRGFPGECRRMGPSRWWIAALLLAVFLVPLLVDPLRAWDARSIWFFQAKRIFYDAGFSVPRGWTNPEYGFSHLDYPKLLPLLAAQFAWAAGAWNEYIPKASLLVLLAPLVFGMLGAVRSPGWSFAFLAGVLLLAGGEMMWNGYLDAYLAAYAALALVFLARWLRAGEALDLCCAIAFMGVAANLKNEGTFIAACAVAAVLVVPRRAASLLRAQVAQPGLWLAIAAPLVCWVVWAVTKAWWHAPNDLQLGMGSIARASQRLAEGGAWLVLQAYGAQMVLVASVAAFIAAAALLGKTTDWPPFAWLPAAAGALYMAGLFAIYLSTPHGLAWHLQTSADRTLLTAALAFLASLFLVLDNMLSPSSPP